jgi:hypothetical protein
MSQRRTALGFGAFVAAIVTAGVVTLVAAAPGGAYGNPGNRTYKNIALNGANEVPPADPDGTGFGTVKIKGKTGQVCVQLKKISGISAATAAHIHQGAVGVDGGIVFNLVTPVQSGKRYQKSKTCGTPDAALLAELQNNPAGYYLNVHNADYPGGAIRGQLG